MKGTFRISRRHLGRLVAALLPTARLAQAQTFDQGIGGTGVAGDPKDESSDQMIGGTGVVGTIRRFGSIYVNDMRITYAASLRVSYGDRSVHSNALQLGQVVRAAVVRDGDTLVARSISVVHEVIGPIEAVDANRLQVSGQTVSLGAQSASPLAVGQFVAVSGLRRLDGTIAASLVERVAPGLVHVAGPLTRGPHGTLAIGDLRVTKVDPSLVGQGVHLTGRQIGSELVVTRTVTDRAMLNQLGTTRWSLEGYVARDATGLRLGSGLQVLGGTAPADPQDLAIVIVTLDRHARLVAERVETERPSKPAGEQTRGLKDSDEKDGSKHDGGHQSGGHHGGGGRH